MSVVLEQENTAGFTHGPEETGNEITWRPDVGVQLMRGQAGQWVRTQEWV